MLIQRLASPVLVLAVAAAPAFAGTSFTFPLTGSQEVPPVGTRAQGQCSAILSGDESTLELHCTHTVAVPIASHIHIGPPGVAGPILFNLGSSVSPIQATWNPTPEEVAELLVGNLYVNVHSPTFPAGAVRGQMLADPRLGDLATGFPLEEAQEVPPTGVAATGRCAATVSSANELSLTCVHDVMDPVAAHIHLGERGVNGPIHFDLGDGTSPIRADIAITETDRDTFLAGGFYVNVHNAAFPGGAIRGQIDGCVADQNTLCLLDGRFAVTADWVAPPGSTFGSGPGNAVRLSADSGTFWFFQPDNAELIVKMRNACTFNDHFWVFASGLTNVEVTLTVTDTRTNTQRTYFNPQGDPFPAIQDTRAFATCP